MPRGFTMTLTMKNAEQAKKALAVMQAELLYVSINDDGTLPQDSLDIIATDMEYGRNEYEVSIANLEIQGNIISMHCTPSADECENGVGKNAVWSIACIYPDFEFVYESCYQDTIIDMFYYETASLKSGKYLYEFRARPSNTSSMQRRYVNGVWEVQTNPEPDNNKKITNKEITMRDKIIKALKVFSEEDMPFVFEYLENTGCDAYLTIDFDDYSSMSTREKCVELIIAYNNMLPEDIPFNRLMSAIWEDLPQELLEKTHQKKSTKGTRTKK